MKSFTKRLLSLTLVLVMLLTVVLPYLPVMEVQASAGPGNLSGVIAKDTGGGITNAGYLIGLGQCDAEAYEGGDGTVESLYKWVDDYSKRHYVAIQGACYSYGLQGDWSTPLTDTASYTLLGSDGDPLGILEAIASGNFETDYTYAVAGSGGTRCAIKPEKVEEVMEKLRDCSESLYQAWAANRNGEHGGHPVVIVIEAYVGTSANRNVGYTVNDLALAAGANITTPDTSDIVMTHLIHGSEVQEFAKASSTAKAIINSATGTPLATYNSVFYWMFGCFFGLTPSGAQRDRNAWGRHINGIATLAIAGESDTDSTITGCYIISIGGFGSDEVKPLYGSYQWDFDAPEIPTNSRGRQEDGQKEISKGESVNGDFKFGYVNLKNDSWATWKSYGQVYGEGTVDLELRVYGLGTVNGGVKLSTDSDTLLSSGTSSANGIISGLNATYTKTGVSWSEFVGDLQNGTPSGFEFDNMDGGIVPATLSASSTNGMIAVVYYTQLFVTPSTGPQADVEIQFSCNQVHYAVYTFQDDSRTYKLAETSTVGWSELKDDTIGSAQFEATTGTPTTEDMFVSMGGSEYLVNMQYALHVEDYDRQYTINVDPYPNYMFYYAADDKIDSIQDYNLGTTYYNKNVSDAKITETPSSHGGSNGGNNAFENNMSAAGQQQWTLFKDRSSKFHDDVQTLLTSIDENTDKYTAVDNYDVIVLGGKLSMTSDWKIEGIEDAVVGHSSKKVNDTKTKLRTLSDCLNKLYIETQTSESAFSDTWNQYHNVSEKISALADGLTITFFDMIGDGADAWKDYDSDADGQVNVTFQFTLVNSYGYKNTVHFYCTDGSYYYDAPSGSGGHVHGDGARHECSDTCQERGVQDHTKRTECNHDDGSYWNEYGQEVANLCSTKHAAGHDDSEKHSHYGHEHKVETYETLFGTDITWTPENSVHSTTHKPKESWSAKITCGIDVDYNAGTDEIAHDYGDRGKMLSYNATLHQIYKSVKYMDIVEAHVWRLAGGIADGTTGDSGLSSLMVEETDTRVISPIIEMACSNLGYTLYNTQSADVSEHWAESLVTPDGHTYNKVWTAIDQDFVDLCTMDEEKDDTIAEMTANTELSAIGRLANSYNPGTTEAMSPIVSGGHALTVGGSGDTLTFTYSIATQGGRSHWSFDGFLKQAIALTFYGDDNPESAYRNYIIVQSDYLSCDDKTLSGFQWASKPMDENDGTYGLTQAILNTGTYEDAADIATYYTNGTYWEKQDSLSTTQVNITLNSKHSNIKDGNGGQSEVLGNSKPSDKTCALAKYAEGPEDWGEYEEYKDDGYDGNTFVILDMNSTYGSWTAETITGGTISGDMGQNANFATEGKGEGATDIDWGEGGEFFPKVGYVGEEDSVKDAHYWEPQGGSSTQFKPDQTLVNGSFGEYSFANYGNAASCEGHLFVANNGNASTGKQVSASGSSKNTVIGGYMFPYVTGLNVIRWMENGTYGGYGTALYYDECLSLYEALPYVGTIKKKTTDAFSRSQFSGYLNSIVTDLHQTVGYSSKGVVNDQTMSSGEGLLNDVGYAGDEDTRTNVITVYNPSTAKNVRILPMSDELPDGQNNPKDLDDRDSGYTVRDQRVDETLVTSSNQESYISYVTLDAQDVQMKDTEYTYELKSKTDYNGGVTEYYTLEDDYVSISQKADTWTVEANSEPMTITKSGNYKLTLYSGNDKDTSVEIYLNAGDKVSTDGTSVYLNRSTDIAPTITSTTLTDAIGKYYQSQQEDYDSAAAAEQKSAIVDWLSRYSTDTTWSQQISTMMTVATSLDFDWPEAQEVDNITPLKETIVAYNKAVSDYNDKVKKLYEGLESNKFCPKDYTFISDETFDDLQAIEEAITEVGSQIAARADELNFELTKIDDVDYALKKPESAKLATVSTLPPTSLKLAQHSLGYYVVVDDAGNLAVDSNGYYRFYTPGFYADIDIIYVKSETDDENVTKYYKYTNGVKGSELTENADPQWFDYTSYYALRTKESELVDAIFASNSYTTSDLMVDENGFYHFYAPGSFDKVYYVKIGTKTVNNETVPKYETYTLGADNAWSKEGELEELTSSYWVTNAYGDETLVGYKNNYYVAVNDYKDGDVLNQILSVIPAMLYETYGADAGDEGLVNGLAALVGEYNTYVSDLTAKWNISGTSYQASTNEFKLAYTDGRAELQSLLTELTTLRDKIESVAEANGQTVILSKVPTINLVSTTEEAWNHDDQFDVEKDAVMKIDFSGLGMSKGSTLVVHLPFADTVSNPASMTLATNGKLLDWNSVPTGNDNMDDYDYTVYSYNKGSDWYWVIEAFDDVTLGAMTFKFNKDASIMKTGDYVYFDKIWLCDVGSSYTNPVYLGTTIEHNYYASGSNYWNNSTRKRSINKVLFDAVGAKAEINVDITTNKLYMSREASNTMVLKADAQDNPHKVYNANWKYYVVGWSTTSGAKITSPNDKKLDEDETVLIWPSEASGTIKVKDLKNEACLVMFGGNIYLTTKEAGLEHKILQIGAQVSQYDLWTLGSTGLSECLIQSEGSGTFPLTANTPATTTSFQQYKYEFFFTTTDYDAPLFNVEYSKNVLYRFASTDTLKNYASEGNWTLDWNRIEKNVGAAVHVMQGRTTTDATANYISLDDEFDVYFDNVAEFPGDASLYDAYVGGNANQGMLGYGWNANGTKLLGSGVNNGITDWYGVPEGKEDTDDVWSTGVDVENADGSVTTETRETTECTGWIYAKYLTFSFDVYVFKDDAGNINPTCNAYDENGNLRDMELVEAGTPVYLGTYLSGTDSDDYQSAAYNKGGFYDYGAPDVTLDKNGDAFTYHFWCPLYNGEANNSAYVQFHTVNINDALAAGNAAGNSNVGDNSYPTQSPTNQDDSTVLDYKHANNSVATSIVGRIGALTIVETGDPRYSDSFKVTDLTNDDVNNFLIYPIVRRVTQYTNTYTKSGNTYMASIGSQRGVVLDPFDVRGRICTDWMVNYVKSKHEDWGDISYKVYASESYDTYNTQWYKHNITRYVRGSSGDSASEQYATALPLTPNFNKHETFANKPVRVGYELYMSVETIGNYFGDSTVYADVNYDGDSDSGATTSNGNNDYGQDKVQVRPFYAAIDATNKAGDVYNGPVDVYMRSGDTYVLINSGCDKTTSTSIDAICTDSEHSISEVLAVLYNNYDPNYIETNTGNTELELDQNMLRRMVTGAESQVTYDVLQQKDTAKSLLTKVDRSTAGVGGEELEIRYTYGCSQMLFLRERNMTYIGGKTAALNYNNPVPSSDLYNNKQYAQKWYFGLGLPSSAVFVPHGTELTPSTILTDGYVVNSIDVVVSGSVWTLHYESEVSKMSFDYEEGSWSYEQWNPWYETYPWLVPVTYYNIGDTSTADLDTQGSH